MQDRIGRYRSAKQRQQAVERLRLQRDDEWIASFHGRVSLRGWKRLAAIKNKDRRSAARQQYLQVCMRRMSDGAHSLGGDMPA